MKKTLKRILKVTMALAAIVLVASCGQRTPTPEEVAKKIDAGETLTQADYAAVLDYCGGYAKKAQQYFDLINTQANDSTPEYLEATNHMANLYAEYPYLDMFRAVVYNIPESSLDAKNKEKVEEYSKYQAFPLPDGAGVDMTNPQVEGDIVDMPDTDTTAVIASGDGEAVDVQVK